MLFSHPIQETTAPTLSMSFLIPDGDEVNKTDPQPPESISKKVKPTANTFTLPFHHIRINGDNLAPSEGIKTPESKMVKTGNVQGQQGLQGLNKINGVNL